ncbi:EF-hand domain-containing protein D2 homolog [Ischnura elegans]|uniref:EF-hand domain-containing protein D2 homolog n=1 Tax=Ischnura elegans TaxID=197161 RepID=UPI001ED8B9EB|nr:EF-hand domain-containing protein D2 homolog [Ischnura elegans]
MPADDELSGVLSRRQAINEALDEGKEVKPKFKVVNVYTEFAEFSRRQIKEYEKTFNRYDVGGDGYLDLEEVKRMMEKLEAPQTHLALKAMIKAVDEDEDGKISFREFLLVYRKAKAGELQEESGLGRLAALTEVDVDAVGVSAAATFFEAKIEEQRKTSKFEDEIKQEKEERLRQEEEKQQRKMEFKKKAALFQNGSQSNGD